jgi:hypothetical protein
MSGLDESCAYPLGRKADLGNPLARWHWIVRASHLALLENHFWLGSRIAPFIATQKFARRPGCMWFVLVLQFFLPPPGGLCGRGWPPPDGWGALGRCLLARFGGETAPPLLAAGARNRAYLNQCPLTHGLAGPQKPAVSDFFDPVWLLQALAGRPRRQTHHQAQLAQTDSPRDGAQDIITPATCMTHDAWCWPLAARVTGAAAAAALLLLAALLVAPRSLLLYPRTARQLSTPPLPLLSVFRLTSGELLRSVLLSGSSY